MAAKNTICVVITCDFNCRASQLWENEIENNERRHFESLTSDIGLYQLILEPTHLMGDSKSCTDLIFTDQRNRFIESGVNSLLYEQCHHQIEYGKLAVSILGPPSYTRKIGYYDKADVVGIKKSVEMFQWKEHLEIMSCPNEQVKLLNEVQQMTALKIRNTSCRSALALICIDGTLSLESLHYYDHLDM